MHLATRWKLLIFLIFAIPAMFVADFARGVESQNMDQCDGLDRETEAFYECLEQSDLSPWAMNNRDLHLTITWGIVFGLIWLIGGSLLTGVVIIILEDTF